MLLGWLCSLNTGLAIIFPAQIPLHVLGLALLVIVNSGRLLLQIRL